MRIFTSNLRKYITGFVEQKHALGFPYVNSERIIANFDRFCAEKYPNETTITEGMGLEWAIMRESEGQKGLCSRVGVVRQLAMYMQREGVETYLIPTGYGKVSHDRYVPHIFTDNELKRIFDASDHLSSSRRDPTSHLVAPVLFRLLYTCGLRPSEGRLIKRYNIDLERGLLMIPESKGHKDRIVIMPDAMTALCRRYEAIMRKMKPDSEYFFPANRSLPVFERHWISYTLLRCWNLAGLGDYSGNKPRPYDFRHTFATKTLYRWIQEGRNLDNCLPYLSAYMGHSEFEDTAYYIHLVPELFPPASKSCLEKFSSLLPEVEV